MRSRQYAIRWQCLSFCLSVCDNRPGASCNLGLPVGEQQRRFCWSTGEGFQKNYELHSGLLAKYPKSHPSLPQKPKSGQFQEIAPQPYLPLKEGLQQMFCRFYAYAGRSTNTPFSRTNPPDNLYSPCNIRNDKLWTNAKACPWTVVRWF